MQIKVFSKENIEVIFVGPLELEILRVTYANMKYYYRNIL